ncbi:pyrroline-5-carboxylate reductase [soil metagenome]
MKIALVGYGKMGAALLSQWRSAAQGSLPNYRYVVIDPAAEPTTDARQNPQGDPVFLSAPPPLEDCAFDLVIMAVKPQILDAVAPLYAGRLAPGGFVASIAAGVSIARLKALTDGPPVVRIMPNLPAAIGAGASGLCADPSASSAQRDMIDVLMRAVGSVLWVEDEDQLDRLTAIAGSGPGYVFEIARTYVEAAAGLGFSPDAAKQLVLDTMAGAIEMARRSPLSLEDLRDSVTSKGGTTAAGLSALNGEGDLDRLFQATLAAAYARAVALR